MKSDYFHHRTAVVNVVRINMTCLVCTEFILRTARLLVQWWHQKFIFEAIAQGVRWMEVLQWV